MRWISRCAIGTCVLALAIVILATVALFGGGGSCPSGVNVPSQATHTPGEVVRYLESQGFGPFAAAGVTGNLMQESTPAINPLEAGGGIAQWLGSRYTAMVSWVTAQGLDPNSLQGQLAFLAYDVRVNYTALLAEMNTAPDPGTATSDFESVYEVCQGVLGPTMILRGSLCNDPARRAYAVQALAAAGSTTVPVSLSLGGAAACAATPLANGAGYVNPYAGDPTAHANRIDMGDDTDAGAGGTISAFGNARITFAQTGIGGGWTCATQINGGVVYELLDGAYAGDYVYLAEDITPLVHAGQTVPAGQPIAQFPPGGCDEMGWEDPSAGAAGSGVVPLAVTLPGFPPVGGDQSPQALACGDSMARFLQSVGAPASVRMGAGAGVTAAPTPGGYP